MRPSSVTSSKRAPASKRRRATKQLRPKSDVSPMAKEKAYPGAEEKIRFPER